MVNISAALIMRPPVTTDIMVTPATRPSLLGAGGLEADVVGLGVGIELGVGVSDALAVDVVVRVGYAVPDGAIDSDAVCEGVCVLLELALCDAD